MDRPFAARWRIPALVAALTAIAIAIVWAVSPTGRPAGLAAGQTGSATPDATSAGATSPGSTGKPPVLFFRADDTMAMGAPMAAAADSRTGAKLAGQPGGYVFAGTFVAGPASSAVFTLVGPTADQVNRLAAAFGLPAAKHSSDMWIATDGEYQLSVPSAARGNWWYSRIPDCFSADGKTTFKCEVGIGSVGSAPAGKAGSGKAGSGTAGSGTVVDVRPSSVGGSGAPCPDCGLPTPVPDPATADEATLRRAAAHIFEGAGVSLGGARVTFTSDSITLNPLVDGLPTVGMETSVGYRAGAVLWANGWLGATVKGDTYPVITAAQALDKLKAQPRMYAMMCTNSQPVEMPNVPETGPAAPKSSPSVSWGPPTHSKPGALATPPDSLPNGGVGTDPGPAGGALGPVMVDPPAKDMPCGNFTPEPITVTGATFGLSLQWQNDDSAVLAPSWLFTMKGNDAWPTSVLAIDPSFLGDPIAMPIPPSIGKGPAPDSIMSDEPTAPASLSPHAARSASTP